MEDLDGRSTAEGNGLSAHVLVGASSIECRICGAGASLWKDRGDVALYRCALCGFVSGRAAQSVPAAQRYEDYYCGPAPASPNARYHEWLSRAEALVGRGRMLEVGAGSGGFVRAALARGWDVDATEISKSALDELRKTGARIFAGDVAAAQYPDRQFNLVVSLEVVEHVPTPLTHLAELCRVTRPPGLLLLTTPNFDGVSRRCLGVRWRVIDPEHLGYFTAPTLCSALRCVGYRDAHVTSRSLDVLSWRRGTGPTGARAFEPHASARLRDAVQASTGLRFGKAVVDSALRLTKLGDSLLVWARR